MQSVSSSSPASGVKPAVAVASPRREADGPTSQNCPPTPSPQLPQRQPHGYTVNPLLQSAFAQIPTPAPAVGSSGAGAQQASYWPANFEQSYYVPAGQYRPTDAEIRGAIAADIEDQLRKVFAQDECGGSPASAPKGYSKDAPIEIEDDAPIEIEDDAPPAPVEHRQATATPTGFSKDAPIEIENDAPPAPVDHRQVAATPTATYGSPWAQASGARPQYLSVDAAGRAGHG